MGFYLKNSLRKCSDEDLIKKLEKKFGYNQRFCLEEVKDVYREMKYESEN